jgi:hypothetical protein
MSNTSNVRDPVILRKQGFNALVNELGPVGAVNFIQQFDRGSGDYTKERHGRYEGMTVEDIAEVIEQKRKV